jgi:hypothetical protein
MSDSAWKQNAKAKAILRDAVFANPAYSLRAKAVFYVLIEHIDLMTLKCNPGRARLAGNLGRGIRTIIRGLAELIEAGEVKRQLTKRSPLYTFPNLGVTGLAPLNQSRGDRSGNSSGDRSGHSSGDRVVTRTSKPDEPIKSDGFASPPQGGSPSQKEGLQEKEKQKAMSTIKRMPLAPPPPDRNSIEAKLERDLQRQLTPEEYGLAVEHLDEASVAAAVEVERREAGTGVLKLLEMLKVH